MSSSVEDRVVAMKFDNSGFMNGVRATLDMLGRLKGALNLGGAAKGMQQVSAAANKMDLSQPVAGINRLSAGFVALSTVAITALSNITSKAVDAGLQIGKSLTIQPILDGFNEYELKMGSIQTILSNTARHGTNLDDVTTSLDELNHYADKTIYNFGAMTKNIGLFTNAGIKLEDATSMIKGFSNEAAASGTSAEGAASAAYQLSQALSAGTVRLMDWRSLQNVGMGNKNMQLGIIEIADAMGTLEKAEISSKDIQDDFNGSLEKGWLSADVMSTYLKIMAGDMTKAEAAALGLDKATVKQLFNQQKMSEDAATKVRTLTQLMGTIKESVGSSWAETFNLVFGDFNEATELFTGINDSIGALISESGEARNQLISDWDALGGRTALIEAIKNAWDALVLVVKPIKEAFRDIFPATTGQRLFDMTDALREFTENLKISGATGDQIRRIFAGIFSIFSTGWEIIKRIAGVFGDIFGAASEGSGSILELAAALGDWLVALNEAVKSGNAIDMIFDAISNGAAAGVEAIKSFLTQGVSALASVDWSGILSSIGDGFAQAFGNVDWNVALAAINTGLLAAIGLLLKKFFDNALDFDFSGGLISDMKNAFGEMEGAMVSIQTNLRADTLQKIAISVGILAASIAVLAMIDPAALTSAMSAIVISFGLLMGAMAIMTKIAGGKGFLTIPVIAASLTLLSTAILILSAAVKVLSTMSWEELAKGLGATAALLVMLTAVSGPLGKNSAGMIKAGLALIPLAIGLRILASSVEALAALSWQELGRGLAGMGGALLVIAAAMWAMPTNILLTSVAILALSVAIGNMADALIALSGLSWPEIGKGLAGIAGALLIVAGAMWLMPPHMLLMAAGLLIVSHALQNLGTAVAQMGGMSWEEIGKGMVVLGGALLILAAGLYLMTGSIAGSAALVIAAAAIAILVPLLERMGSMEWGAIIKALVMLASTFAIIAVAGLLLAPVALVLLAFGAALALVGAGLLAAGLGVLAFASALALLAKGSKAGIDAMINGFKAMLGVIPQAAKAFAAGIVTMVQELAKAAPKMIGAFVKIVSSMLEAVQQLAPKIGKTFLVVIKTALKVIENAYPWFVMTGIRIINKLLNGIAQNIPSVARAATNVIIAFINAIATEVPRLADAGAKAVIKFVNGIAAAIDANAGELRAAGLNVARAIIDGMTGGLASGIGEVVSAAKNVAKSALDGAKNLLGINSPSKEFYKVGRWVDEGFANGLVAGLSDVRQALGQMHAIFKESIDRANKTIQEEEANLKKLRNQGKRDQGAIKKAEKALRAAKKVKEAMRDANRSLTESEKTHNKELFKLARQLDQNTKKLDAANQKLADAKAIRDDFNASTKDSFDDLPDVEQGQTYDQYEYQVRNAISANQKFEKSLEKLEGMGLSDQSYKKLLEEGVDSQALIDSIIAGGKGAVTEFNNLNKTLDNSAKNIANDASKSMYQAGVDTAQGVVDGLKKNEKKIERQMERIAKKMVRAIKKELGIKSPSREMIEIAKFITQGLKKGLDTYGKSVDSSAAALGDRVLDNVKYALSQIPNEIAANADLNPTITPVLDLTTLAAQATGISSALGSGVVNLDGVYEAGQQSIRSADSLLAPGEGGVPPGTTLVQFSQTNNSPKALSTIDIFRNTNNQLSIAKEALR